MILPDSSAWVEYLRRTESSLDRRLDELIRSGAELATTEPVVMELLAGARDDDRRRVRRMLGSLELIAVDSPTDWEAAADLYRACRRAGETPRNLLDCLIASIAIRTGLPVLHLDADFDLIARHTSLQIPN